MRIVKEAYTDHCKLVVAPDYVSIQHFPTDSNSDPIHLTREEALEAVQWLSGELGRILPEIMTVPMPSSAVAMARAALGSDHNVWNGNVLEPTAFCEPVYEPGARTATQTVELKLGDPNLAYRHTGGRTAIAGDGEAGISDLGALAEKVGRV